MIRNFVVQMITPVALANIGYQYYIVYTLIAFCFPIIAFLFYPETMGQSLEKLEQLFQRDLSVYETVRLANNMAKHPDLPDMVDEDVKAKAKEIELSEKHDA